MRIAKILDPDFHGTDLKTEMDAILSEVSQVQYTKENDKVDDRIFIDVSGQGEQLWRMFCQVYPELRCKLIPLAEKFCR